MKRNQILVLLLTACCATAQAASEEPVATQPVQRADLVDAPPPAMDDPGVKPKAAPPSDLEKAKADARAVDEPDVGIRQEGDDTIEEYRKSGKVSMIRVTGKNGVTRTYIDTDGDGRLEGNPKDGPVAPVYYKLYEWN